MPKKQNPTRKKASSKKPNFQGEFAISKEDQEKYYQQYQNSLQNLDFKADIKEEKKDPSTLWVDVYAPKTLKEYISDNKDLETALTWLDDFRNKRPSTPRYLLMTGRPGIGKTTLAHLMLKDKDYDYQEFNASDIRSGSELRDRLESFGCASILSFFVGCSHVKKALIMDEVDGIDTKGKESDGLSTFLNLTTKDTSYPVICIANDADSTKISKIRRKSCEIAMKDPSKKSLLIFLKRIIAGEKFKIDKKVLSMIIEDSDADYRQVANKLHTTVIEFTDPTKHKITVELYEKIRDKCLTDKCGLSLAEINSKIMSPDTNLSDALNYYESDIGSISLSIFSSYLLNLDQTKASNKAKFKALGELSRGTMQGEIFSNYYWKNKTGALNVYQGANQVGTARLVFHDLAKKGKTKINWKTSSKMIFYLNSHMMNRIWKIGLGLDIHSDSNLVLTVETLWNLLKSKAFREKNSTYQKILKQLFEMGFTSDDFESIYKDVYVGGPVVQANEKIYKIVGPIIKKYFKQYSEDRSKKFQESLQSSQDQFAGFHLQKTH